MSDSKFISHLCDTSVHIEIRDNNFKGSYWGDHDWEVGDEDDAAARKAYEALLRVSLLQPTSPRFQDFADSVRQRAQSDYNYTFSEGEEVSQLKYFFLL